MWLNVIIFGIYIFWILSLSLCVLFGYFLFTSVSCLCHIILSWSDFFSCFVFFSTICAHSPREQKYRVYFIYSIRSFLLRVSISVWSWRFIWRSLTNKFPLLATAQQCARIFRVIALLLLGQALFNHRPNLSPYLFTRSEYRQFVAKQFPVIICSVSLLGDSGLCLSFLLLLLFSSSFTWIFFSFSAFVFFYFSSSSAAYALFFYSVLFRLAIFSFVFLFSSTAAYVFNSVNSSDRQFYMEIDGNYSNDFSDDENIEKSLFATIVHCYGTQFV